MNFGYDLKFTGIPKRHSRRVRNVWLLENNRYVSMPDKAVATGEIFKAPFRQRLLLSGQVLPERPIGTAMYKRAFTHVQAFGQVFKKCAMFLGQLFCRP